MDEEKRKKAMDDAMAAMKKFCDWLDVSIRDECITVVSLKTNPLSFRLSNVSEIREEPSGIFHIISDTESLYVPMQDVVSIYTTPKGG